MKCDKCNEDIENGEEREIHGQVLCEDCCVDVLSPVKTCDPWAVHSAKSFSNNETFKGEMTDIQSKILKVLKDTGGAEPKTIIEQLNITPSDFEREFATLRHMEKARAQMRDTKKIFCLW